MNITNKMVILDARTRWNSTFDMLVRARELKEVSLIITFKIYNNNIIKRLLLTVHYVYHTH